MNEESKSKLTGKGINRVDGRLKVKGLATYSGDYVLKDLAYGVLLQSSIAHGKIVSIDTSKAEAAAGVICVMTRKNAPIMNGSKAVPFDTELALLQDDDVTFDRQNIGIVVANTIEQARYAAELVQFKYAAQKPKIVTDLTTASGVFRPDLERDEPYRVLDTNRGDADSAFQSSDTKVDETYVTPRENHNPMEPHATTAVWNGDKVTVYDSSQGIFAVQARLAHIFCIPRENVRVVTKFIGGGFGCKSAVWSHVPLTVAAARMARRPVRVTLDRQQTFGPVGFRPMIAQRVKLGADKHGKLRAIKHEGRMETATFDNFVEYVGMQARFLYSCPNVYTSHRLVKSDIGKPTVMRGIGECTGSFALESAMDELSYKLKMDPIELRKINYAEIDEHENLPYSSKSLKQCYEQGAQMFGWSRRKSKPTSMRDGGLLVGMGMATVSFPVHRMPASAKATFYSDGTCMVESGSQDLGTGTYTIMTQLAADRFSLPLSKVKFNLGDTDLPATWRSGASTTAGSVGSAVQLACDALIDKFAELTSSDNQSPLFQSSRDDMTVEDGALRLIGDTSKLDKFSDILRRRNLKKLEAQAFNDPHMNDKKYSMHSFGALFAEVKVDPDLGVVRVSRMVGVYGVGRILNAKTARNQLLGGITMGIGMAMLEETLIDPRYGRVINADLAEYHLPVNLDIPDIQIAFVDEDEHYANPIGVKGIGEIGTVGAAAAIANAVYHATGQRVRRLPITLDKVVAYC